MGASGDLAPLSHMTLALLGEGEMLDGQRVPARRHCRRRGIAPLQLAAKEGLALINGTQTSTALALHALLSFEPVLESALVIGALTPGRRPRQRRPVDPRIHAVRGQQGQIDVAQYYRALLARQRHPRRMPRGTTGCKTLTACAANRRVGACLDQMRHSARILRIEANAVTDNPLVFANDGSMISGGNFHAEPVALAADGMALAIAEVGAIAERRIAMLIDASVSRLPPFLVPMWAEQRLHDRPRHRRRPRPARTKPGPPGQRGQPAHQRQPGRPREHGDFCSPAPAGHDCNTAHILGIELLASAQAIDFLRPLHSSDALEQAHALFACTGAAPGPGPLPGPDIEAATALVHRGALSRIFRSLSGLPVLWAVAL